MKLSDLNIVKINEGFKKKEFSAEELTRAYLDRIKKIDDKIKSYIAVTEELALKQAKEADERIAEGEADGNMLLGVPVSIKDVITTQGVLTTASSNILRNYIPPHDATLVKRLKDRGMVMLGKVNCDAFAHGASTENSDFFVTRNPWDVERVPGGSSGGSASSVSADECAYSIGTDTGGSIRCPAAFCSLVGLKPTYGRISRYGLISMTSSTDCPGIIAKTVKDAAIVLGEIAGKDEKDSTSSDKEVDNYSDFIERKSIKGVKIGIPKEYFIKELDQKIRNVLNEATQKFESLGARIVDISLPHTKYAVPTYYIITPSEVSSNLARFDGIKYGYSELLSPKSEIQSLKDIYFKSRGKGFGKEAKRRIMLGTYALSSGYYDAYYLKAQKVRSLIKKDFDEAFGSVDVILTPTMPNVAFKIGEHSNNPLELYLEDVFSSAASLAGLPAMSIPCGFVKPENGEIELPIGMQIIGKPFDEKNILNLGEKFEKSTQWHARKPNI